MKYFLDFGTHHFEGLQEFIVKLGIDNTFNVYCFEPNKEVYNVSRQHVHLYENKFESFRHYNAAVMDYTGEITFNRHKGAWSNHTKAEESYNHGYTCGSNCLGINPSYDSGNGVVFDIISETTRCIDIEEIMNEICKNDGGAEIYIKCDIEGSEFVVLPKLLNLNPSYIACIKEIYVEWHERFWFGLPDYVNKVNEKSNIIRQLNERNIKYFTHT